MQTVGIIAGLGPETSSRFYLELLKTCQKINPQLRPEILMDSVAMDLEIEKDFINGADKSIEYVEILSQAAKNLENAGADFLVIPCNTVHLFIKNIRQAVKIPVLSIIDETIKFLEKEKIQKIALLATQNTISSGLYTNPLLNRGIKTEFPSEKDQKEIGVLISKLVKNDYLTDDKEQLITITNHLSEKNVELVLLACTDLQLLAPKHPKIKIYDSMEILVKATAEEINKKT